MPGVLFGTVKDTKDPKKLGRVQVLLTDHGDGEVVLEWLRVIQPLASADFGAVWLPELQDNVVVLQGPGGVDGMLVLGSLYSGKRKPPGEAKVEHKHLLTKGGHEILLDDTSGAEKIKISTKDAKIEILLDQATPGITITAGKEITVNADSKVIVKAAEVAITGSSKVTIGSDSQVSIQGAQIEVKADATVKITGGMIELG